MDINKKSPIPLYYQLKELIMNDIRTGVYHDGDLIPTEKELMEKYDLSRTTVRQALNELVYEGFLKRKKGVGTFVHAENDKNVDFVRMPVSILIRGNGYRVHTKLISFSKEAVSKPVADKLKLLEGEEVYVMERVRFGDDTPMIYSRSFVGCRLIPQLETEYDDACESFHEYLKTKGLRIAKIKKSITATIANKRAVEILKLPNTNYPVMMETDLCFNEKGEPVEYSESLINTKLLEMSSVINVE